MKNNSKIKAVKEAVVSIPTYTIGPLLVNGEYATGEFYVPLTVTEKAIIPSVNRGRKVTSLSGGVTTRVLKDEMTRAPLFITDSSQIATEFKTYILRSFKKLKQIADSTTQYGQLKSLEAEVVGSDIYLRIGMFCGDAAGHNMTTKAAEAIANYLVKHFTSNVRLGSLSSNYCSDKKPAYVNIEKGRGKSVEAEITIPEKIIQEHLKTTGRKIVELNRKKNVVGSELAGSLGKNAHHANIVAALFLATGQDIANVVEGSMGTTRAEYSDNELYFAVELPALIVGTVGGGTNLDYAQENLQLLKCHGPGKSIGYHAKKLSEIIAATVLAGELSLMAALTNNDELIKAHLLYERGIR